MPYVLRHKETGEIAASLQKNHYDLIYYGVKLWPGEKEALEAMAAYLEAECFPEPDRWEALHVREERAKVMNVKLKNNPSLRLFMEAEGTLTVQADEGPQETVS
ncbi:hypothetical protein ACVNS2_18180 [Paenibacillus caseinilyticus]|uniref:Uncharacterized protein n=1 Tax=Paenibacillus mucilaginosus K02 TaxID=997761 RepID=I0BJN0_9BACL|nr:hypothetical protein [Paenibacillus mucilaginosus]AFH62577.1 hypothetical protein B2K_17925 [Paenibacillus mucilaginosus K02]